MHTVKKARRVLKALGEDTRLRMLNLLRRREMNVAQLCEILGSTQPNISKHLARLRLLGIVSDRREGQFIYYRLTISLSEFHRDLIDCVLNGLSEADVFKADLAALGELADCEQRGPDVASAQHRT